MNEKTQSVPEHPYITRHPGIGGGEPVIVGSRVRVSNIAALYKAGESIDQIARAFPHIPREAILDAIAYYQKHREEIDKLIEESRIERVLEKHGAWMDAGGVVHFKPSPSE